MHSMHETPASGPYSGLLCVQLGHPLPVRKPPADLLAALGTRRRPRTDAPLIFAWCEGSQLVFRCSWCRRNHYHGAHSTLCSPECPCPKHEPTFRRAACICRIGTGNGHRGAHCTRPDSPYRATGYYLREVTG